MQTPATGGMRGESLAHGQEVLGRGVPGRVRPLGLVGLEVARTRSGALVPVRPRLRGNGQPSRSRPAISAMQWWAPSSLPVTTTPPPGRRRPAGRRRRSRRAGRRAARARAWRRSRLAEPGRRGDHEDSEARTFSSSCGHSSPSPSSEDTPGLTSWSATRTARPRRRARGHRRPRVPALRCSTVSGVRFSVQFRARALVLRHSPQPSGTTPSPRCLSPRVRRRRVLTPASRAGGGRSTARPSSRWRGTRTASSAACGSRSPGWST